MTSALHHTFVLARTLMPAAVLRHCTTLLALGAATSAGAREGEARRREGEPRHTERLAGILDVDE